MLGRALDRFFILTRALETRTIVRRWQAASKLSFAFPAVLTRINIPFNQDELPDASPDASIWGRA